MWTRLKQRVTEFIYTHKLYTSMVCSWIIDTVSLLRTLSLKRPFNSRWETCWCLWQLETQFPRQPPQLVNLEVAPSWPRPPRRQCQLDNILVTVRSPTPSPLIPSSRPPVHLNTTGLCRTRPPNRYDLPITPPSPFINRWTITRTCKWLPSNWTRRAERGGGAHPILSKRRIWARGVGPNDL